MTRSRPISLLHLIVAGILLAPASLWALPDDQQQPIRIQSNSAEIDDSRGVAIYIGDVNVVQGSIKVLADKVTVHNSKTGISKVVATGAPAHYQQQRAAGSAVTNAYGNIVEYRIQDQFISILKNARLEEEGNSFSGERIDYDMRKRTVKAYSDDKAPSGDKNSRVEIIIQPRAVSAETDSGANAPVEEGPATMQPGDTEPDDQATENEE